MKKNADVLLKVKNEICAAVEAVKHLTNADVAIYDINGYMSATGIEELVPSKLRHHDCEYCTFVRSLPGGRVRCINCDKAELMDSVQKQISPFEHRCFAGLTEIMIPVFHKHSLFMVVYIGQARIDDYHEDAIKTLSEMGVKLTDAIEIYKKLPVSDIEKLRSGAVLLKHTLEHILELVPEQIISEAYISNESLVSHQVKRITASRAERFYSIKDIADELFMSPQMLSRIYRKETGISLKSMLDQQSYSLALRFLADNKMSMESIIANLGFENEAAFRRWLKKQSTRQGKAHAAVTIVVPHYTQRIQQYIHLHYRERISIDDLARDLKISPDHMNRVYKKETGQTISLAIWNARLESAKKELLQTSLSIGYIASHNGFSSKQDFIRRFEEQYGSAPDKYRAVPGQ